MEIYRSDTLAVRSFPGEDGTRWVVTFDHYSEDHSLDRAGFGERFFVPRGISVVTVVGIGNDWYQYPDMTAALAAIREAVAGAARVLTYGSSMGGYAAIRFARAIGAHACLALSPQYSIDPRKVPFEGRWPQESRAIRWRPELDGPIDSAIAPILVYDNHSIDTCHVALIAAETAIAAVPIPYAAHPVTTYLGSAGLLEPMVIGALDGTFDAEAFRLEARRRRHADPIFVAELARIQPRRRGRLGVAIARRALDLAPDTDLMHFVLAKRLSALGLHEEALPAYARAVDLSGGHLGYSLPYSMALEKAGQAGAALALARELAAGHPGYAKVMFWAGRLAWRAGADAEAIRAIAAALRLNPRDLGYRAMLAWVRIAAPLRAAVKQSARVLGAGWRRRGKPPPA